MQKKKIDILFFLPNLYGGGAERVTINIIRELDSNDFNIHLVLVKKVGTYLTSVPDYVKIYDLDKKKTIFSILSLRNLINKIEPDIIYSTLFRTHIAAYLALLSLRAKPIIVMRSPNSPKLIIAHNQLRIFELYFLKKAYAYADLVIAQTPEMKKELIDFHSVQANKIKVLLNPIDTHMIDNKILNINNPFSNKFINIVAAGRIGIQKGFDILIQAFAQVVRENNNFRLYILGEDVGEKDNLLSLAKDLHVVDYIYFLGFKDNPYKYFYYSDMFVLSSRWEGLPNTVLENLYLKKPVVATKCMPFLESIIIDTKNGLLVNVEDPSALAQAILTYEKIDVNFSPEIKKAENFQGILVDLVRKNN